MAAPAAAAAAPQPVLRLGTRWQWRSSSTFPSSLAYETPSLSLLPSKWA
jgi:hypothetical protein